MDLKSGQLQFWYNFKFFSSQLNKILNFKLIIINKGK